MNLRKRLLPVLLAAGLLWSAAGCGAQESPSPPTGTAPAEEGLTLYDLSGGLQLAIPTEYIDKLIVQTDFPEADPDNPWGTPLFFVFEKASVEALEQDYGDSQGGGFLFGIDQMSQATLERHLCGDGSGTTVFAQKDGTYYAKSWPSDVQFYRSSGEIDKESQDWADWETLNALGDTVCQDFLRRNGLSAYDESAFYEKEFTYDGPHAYVKYYSYFTFDGSTSQFDTLVLSQPVRQGAGGLWCVERMYDERGNVYPWFPDSGMAAADYYAQLQVDCDAGKRPDLLTPLGAAKEFVENGFFEREAPDGSLEETSGLDTVYMETNRQISDLVIDMYFHDTVDDFELLDCVGNFRVDNWKVLGRSHYGSDWWTPLKAALEQSAVGDRQADRDRDMMRFYLNSYGQYAEFIAGLLQTQRAADTDAFDTVLAEFPAEQQPLLRQALEI